MRTLNIRHYGIEVSGVAVEIDAEATDERSYGYICDREALIKRILSRRFKEKNVTVGEEFLCDSDDLEFDQRLFKVVKLRDSDELELIEKDGQSGMLRDIEPNDPKEVTDYIAERQCDRCEESLQKGARLALIKDNHRNYHRDRDNDFEDDFDDFEDEDDLDDDQDDDFDDE